MYFIKAIEREEDMDIKNLIKETNEIYKFLGDELSRKIFCDRLLYSLTGDTKNMFRIIQYIPQLKEVIKKLDSIGSDKPKYIYGAGIRGKALKKIWPYDWKGFIDQNENLAGIEVNGLSVISCRNIKNRADAVVIVPNRFFAKEIVEKLVNYGVKKEHIFDISEIWNELTERQYFDLPEMIHSKDEVFVDDGAFDGISTIRFVKWANNNLKRVYIWEPDPQSMKTCRDNLKTVVPIEKCVFVNKASWSIRGTISFTGEGVLFSADENGCKAIETSTITDELQTSDIPTFIKMDIEGAESQSLYGCSELIKKHCPKLAISIYHKPEDIFDLLKLILSFNNNYKFYLRHYSCVDWDTVLYALPK